MVVTTAMLGATSYLYLQADRAVADAQQSFRRQVLTINELLVQIGSNDWESKRRLAGAHHNLAESYRMLSEKTGQIDGLQQAVEHLKVAQQTRRDLLTSNANEKIRFEIAKGDYALASTLQAARFAESFVSLPAETLVSNQAIEEAFLRAVDGFKSLSESTLYSLESSLSQAIVLRELSVLGLDEEAVPESNFQIRRSRSEKSCELLAQLSFNNPLVQRYQTELKHSQAYLCRIINFQASAGIADAFVVASDKSLPAAINRDKEACLAFLQLGIDSDALQICLDAKATIDSASQDESLSTLEPLIDFINQGISEIQVVQ